MDDIDFIDGIISSGSSYHTNQILANWVADKSKESDLSWEMKAYEVIVRLSRFPQIKDHLRSKCGSSEIHKYVFDSLSSKEIPVCDNGSAYKFNKSTRQYGFCNRPHLCACSAQHRQKAVDELWSEMTTEKLEAIKTKHSSTMMANHGVAHAGQLSNNREALRSSRIKGSEGHAKLLANTKKTNQDRFGSDWATQNKDVKTKIRNTNIERTGFENPKHNPETIAKSKETLLHNYGEIGHAHPIITDKVRQTNTVRYGTDNPMQNSEVKAKTRKTIKEKYGRNTFSQSTLSDTTYALLQNREAYVAFSEGKSCREIAMSLNVNSTTICNYHRDYGLKIADHASSSYEEAIAKTLDVLGVRFIRSERTIIGPKHLDFYLPDHNLAIEVNGVYWHSTACREEVNYHRDKYTKCRDAGVRLIMINTDEYDHNPSAIKQKLTNILGKSIRGVGARKLSLRPISHTEANIFFDKHHIQGSTGTLSAAYAGFHNDEMVVAMGFNRQRNTGAIELVRFCSDEKTYAGAFSRLFKHATKDQKYTEVLSFADLRYSIGEVYEKNGFTLVDEIRPDYRYVINNKTYHKSSFTKKRIEKKFGLDMNAMTEREAMESLNIPRIYDCGKLKYIWKG